MKAKYKNEIKAIITLSTAILLIVSFVSYAPEDLSFNTSHPNIPVHNWARSFGAWIAGILSWLFGRFPIYIMPIVLITWGIKRLKDEIFIFGWPNFLGFFFLTLSISTIIGTIFHSDGPLSFQQGGFFGSVCSNFLVHYVGFVGAYIVSLTIATLSFYLVSDFSVLPILRGIKGMFKTLKKGLLSKPIKQEKITLRSQETTRLKTEKEVAPIPQPKVKLDTTAKPLNIEIKPQEEILPRSARQDEKLKKSESSSTSQINITYKLPPLDLLDSPPPLSMRNIKEDLQGSALILEETLADFGISVKVTDIERGPVITRYELEPAPGVKVQRISALSDDIALAMKAVSVRIVAPIPGKARVGIEVPNSQSNLVYFKDIVVSDKFKNTQSLLTLGLGKDIAGMPVITNLAEMPHLLIAGTTGSGKTVCVNSLIISMLYKAKPNEVKFLMVDPKMVELMPFNGLPHLLCPVVTDAKKVSSALNWVVKEMEERYNIFASEGTRNIDIYNERRENPQDKLPYIVIVIDELADLMAVAASQIENAITRLAQLSRAVGIHLILATQRPSVDVITGVIKANFPARVSFKVASKVDSRTVLDSNGADKLLGKGDMLFLKPGESKLIRAQGSLIQDKEIDRIVDFVKKQASPIYNEEILEKQQQASASGNFERDELFDEALRVIVESNQASVSILQRRMRLGYTRAARIIDSLEAEGLIGPFEGSKPRKILVNREEWLQRTVNPQQSNNKQTVAD